jgi:transcriptional activator of cad operon
MVARDGLLVAFRLGDCHVEPGNGRVTSSHGTARLSPKAMAVLLRLCNEPDAVVARNELLHSAWGEQEQHQEKLNQAIREIRAALDDSLHEARYIQTVPRQGYRLLVSQGAG